MATILVNIAVTDEYQEHDHFSEVVQSCQRVGLQVEKQMERIGVLSGSVDFDRISDLNKVKGVASVEESGQIQLPSPGSKIQ